MDSPPLWILGEIPTTLDIEEYSHPSHLIPAVGLAVATPCILATRPTAGRDERGGNLPQNPEWWKFHLKSRVVVFPTKSQSGGNRTRRGRGGESVPAGPGVEISPGEAEGGPHRTTLDLTLATTW